MIFHQEKKTAVVRRFTHRFLREFLGLAPLLTSSPEDAWIIDSGGVQGFLLQEFK